MVKLYLISSADGLTFFLSTNRVILSAGDENGSISAKYFSKVINRKTSK
jgi:hypothetical protein